MPDVVWTRQFNEKVHVQLVRGDAWDIPADACIAGRARQLAKQAEARSKLEFAPLDIPAVSRRLTVLNSPRLPWHHLFLVDYRPGSNNPVAFAPKMMSHALRLSIDLRILILHAFKVIDGDHLLILPLSARNPRTVCAATVDALYDFGGPNLLLSKRGSLRVTLADLEDPTPFQPWLEKRLNLIEYFQRRVSEFYSSS